MFNLNWLEINYIGQHPTLVSEAGMENQQIYPNPAKDILNIETGNKMD